MRNFDLSFASSLFYPNGNLSFGNRRASCAPTASAASFDAAGLPVSIPVDIAQSDKAYLLTADIPGVDPATIEVSVHDGLLRLKGERPTRPDGEGSAVSRRERRTGSFERSFTLPKGAHLEGIEVTAADGVLEISIPKGKAGLRRRIDVQGYSAPVVPAAQPPPEQVSA